MKRIISIGLILAIILALPLLPFVFGQSSFIINLSDDFNFVDTKLVTCPIGCIINQIQDANNLTIALSNVVVAVVTLLVPALIVVFSITYMFAQITTNRILITLIFGISVLMAGILNLIPIWYGIVIFIIVIVIIMYTKIVLIDNVGVNE